MLQKLNEQQTDTDDPALFKRARNVAERNVSCNERDGQFAAGQTHRKIFYTAALGEEFGLTREFETSFVHSRFMDWAGDDRVKLSASRARDCFFERGCSGARGFD